MGDNTRLRRCSPSYRERLKWEDSPADLDRCCRACPHAGGRDEEQGKCQSAKEKSRVSPLFHFVFGSPAANLRPVALRPSLYFARFAVSDPKPHLPVSKGKFLNRLDYA